MDLVAKCYSRLVEAASFYRRHGFQDIEAPWTVSSEIVKLTLPSRSKASPLGDRFLVGSAEQGFLQMISNRELLPGRYQSIGPCFRDDPPSKYHRPYFMKLELIDIADPTEDSLEEIVSLAKEWFSFHVKCRIEETQEDDPLSASKTYDVVTASGLELGSYGIREHVSVGRWVYGTGCAEPRLSQSIQESKI